MPSSANKHSSEEHGYIPPRDGDRRSPCPGLNAMANHGFLPRNGRDIGFFDLIRAMRGVYNMSFPLAALLAIVGLILCGHWRGFRRCLDLDALAAHNKIEHDASLVHVDAKTGETRAPTTVDKGLLHKLMNYGAPASGLVLNDFARARHDREALLTKPLDGVHEEIAYAESAMTWLIMKDETGAVPSRRIEEWFGEERLPEGWVRPAKTVGLVETRGLVKKLKGVAKASAPSAILIDTRFGPSARK